VSIALERNNELDRSGNATEYRFLLGLENPHHYGFVNQFTATHQE
jgi:hypothetical protein